MSYDPTQLQAGDLRHCITIQAPNNANVDAFGQPVSTWTNILTTRAKIEGTTSTTYKQLATASAISAQATDIMTIRWPGCSIDIAPSMRVKFGDNTYLIQDVDNVLHRNRVIKLICMAIDADSN